MIVPVRLHRRDRDGAIVATLEPGESGKLICGPGAEFVESEAERSGVAAYLRAKAAQTKAVEKGEVEDKAVDARETENKGLSLEPDVRRGAGRPPRAPGA